MQVSKIMIAVAALALGSAAFAAPAVGSIAIASGASASKNNLKINLAGLCTSAGGTLTEFASGNNISTYVCGPSGPALTAATYSSTAAGSFKNFTGTAFSEVRLNVNGGSFTAVCLLNRVSSSVWPSGSCATVNGTVSANDAHGVADKYVKPDTGALDFYPAGAVVVGGLMDVEPGVFPSSVLGSLAIPTVGDAGFAQVFGVAASQDLWNAMYTNQQSTGKLGANCPATPVAATYALAECIPTIGKAQMATIMSDNAFGSITAAGAGFLAPSLLDASGNGPVLTYARRNDTSGTQATAQAYFMGTSCNTVAPLPVIAANTTAGQLVAQGLSSTGNVRTQLNINGVSPAKVYSIGIMSAENNQTGQTWKWLRVGGASGVDSAVPDAAVTNSASAIDGRFDYWFESKVAAAPSPASAGNFWTAVTGNWGVLSAGATKGLFALSETQFTKGGAGCQPAASN